MLKIFFILIALIFAIVLILAATKPDTFRVERSASIKAPPEKIFPYLNDFHQWTAWSVWEKKDSDMKTTYSGSLSGKGAVYEWDGNNNVGKGRMEIVESTIPTKLIVKLDFSAPMEGHNKAEFTLQADGDNTKAIWVMDGPSPFISKLIGVFISMDKMIGKDFEDSLANLKAAAEKS